MIGSMIARALPLLLAALVYGQEKPALLVALGSSASG